MAEMMKRIVMFFEGRLLPARGGTVRVVSDIARHLHSLPDTHLTLVVLDNRMSEDDLLDCREICHAFVRLRPAARWSVIGVLNGLAHKFGGDVHAAYFRALAIRRQMRRICADADLVVVNSTAWYPSLPAAARKTKAVVITHDILFQRRASFRGKGVWLAVCRWFELKVLKTFRKVIVFADYERDLLLAAGMPVDRIVQIGLPIVCPEPLSQGLPKEYDFVLIGANCLQNEEAIASFFSRVVPLLGQKKTSLAVVGDICHSPVWEKLAVPEQVCVHRLGYVDDVRNVCARSCIGVSTPTHGSGIKVKTVECIEHGLPMVVTDCGEEGVPTVPESVVNIDRLPSERVAERIGRWLDHPEMAAEAGRRQAQVVRQAFSPQNCLANLVSLVQGRKS